jgi:hypothetical protein
MSDLTIVREQYAKELRAVSRLRNATLVAAFGWVPREQFVGRGPWQIIDASKGDLT